MNSSEDNKSGERVKEPENPVEGDTLGDSTFDQKVSFSLMKVKPQKQGISL